MIRKSLLINAGWLAGDRVVRLGGGLLVGVWIARYLGPRDFGVLNYTMAFSALFGILATLGLDGIVIREGINKRFHEGVLFGTAFYLRLYGSFFGLAVSVALGALSGSTGDALIMIALGSGVYIAQSLYVIDWYFQASSNNKMSVIAQNGAFLVSNAAKIALIVLKMPVIMFAVCNVAEALLASAMLLVLYTRSKNAGWSFDKGVARTLLAESWPLILSGLAFMIYVRLDQVMIGHMLGDTAVGVYAAAIRISEVWNMVPFLVITVAFPRLLELRITNKASYDKNMQILFSCLVAMSFVAAIAAQMLGDWAVTLMFGPSYIDASSILKISIWSAIFSSLGAAGGRWLIAENLIRYALFRNVVGVLVNFVGNLILIPILGAKGAALATLASYMFANFLSYASTKALRPLFFVILKALLLHGIFPLRRKLPKL